MDPRLYLRARAIRPPPLRFYRRLDPVTGRWGKVRRFRNPLALSLLCTCRRVAGSSYLPDSEYIALRRDMYRSAKLFSNGRLFGTLPRYWRLARRKRARRGRVLFFFFFPRRPRIFRLRINRRGNAAAGNVCECQPTRDNQNAFDGQIDDVLTYQRFFM